MTSSSRWTFITNHGLVLSYVAHFPKSTAREIAQEIEVTERTVHKIISDLEDAGYVTRRKAGRRNVYSVDPTLPLRHHTKKDVLVSELLEALTSRDLHDLLEPPEALNAGEDAARSGGASSEDAARKLREALNGTADNGL